MKYKILVLLIVLLHSCKSISQESDISKDVNDLVSGISWESFKVVTKYGTELRIDDENAVKLEKLGKSISSNLVEALKTADKAVIAHMILTKIWEPAVFQIRVWYPSEESNKDELLTTQYLLNNLVWYEFVNDGNRLSIDKFDQEKIYKYWIKRIDECSPDGASVSK